MPSVVLAAAVAGGEDADRRYFSASSLLSPFKRRRKTLDEEPITEEANSRSESIDRGPADRSRVESRGYRSVDNRERTGGVRQHSSSSESNGYQETHYRDPGEQEFESERGDSGTPLDEETHLHQSFPSPEENEEDDGDQYLLTTAPYGYLVRLFALVPLTSLLTILLLVLLLCLWPSETWSASFAAYLGLSVFAAATWIVSFALRIPLYLLSSFLCRLTPTLTPFFSTLVQVFSEEALRLCSLILVHIHLKGTLRPSDPTFPGIWALGIGWATAEVAVSVWQGYEQLALYKDVLSPDDSTGPLHLPQAETWIFEGQTAHPRERQFIEDPEGFMQEGIDRLVRVRARNELEEVYGVPFPNIPVFISCLQRIDSIIFSLALFLLISSSYLSNLTSHVSSPPLHMLHSHHVSQAIRASIPTLLVVVVLHTCVAFIWTANLLPRIGIHTASYIGSVVALGSFFAGLGRWGAL